MSVGEDTEMRKCSPNRSEPEMEYIYAMSMKLVKIFSFDNDRKLLVK